MYFIDSLDLCINDIRVSERMKFGRKKNRLCSFHISIFHPKAPKNVYIRMIREFIFSLLNVQFVVVRYKILVSFKFAKFDF